MDVGNRESLKMMILYIQYIIAYNLCPGYEEGAE